MIDRIVKDHKTHTFNSIEAIREKLNYYRDLSSKGLHKLNSSEFEDLKKDFSQFLNIEVSFWADTYPTKLFRVTINQDLCDGKKQKLQNISQLIGPPKGMSGIGRCNLPGESIFYSALNLKTAIWEKKPQPGDYVTISQWEIKDNEQLNTHNIFHPELTSINEESNKAYQAHTKAKKHLSPEIAEIFEEVLYFLTEEYMKEVKREEDYFFSAYYSSRLLQSPPDENGFQIEAISYPSIQMEYGLTNFAIKNSLVFDKLDLIEVNVLDIGEVNYEDPNVSLKNFLKVYPVQPKATEFNFKKEQIEYDLEHELNQAIEAHRQSKKNNS